MTKTLEKISLEEAHKRMREQGVSASRHYAFICPICHTVQSMASLVKAGAKPDSVESYIGFSCEGRFSGIGSYHTKGRSKDTRGCDWTLGGLFRLHTLEIEYENGEIGPRFEIAGATEAQALEHWIREAEHEE